MDVFDQILGRRPPTGPVYREPPPEALHRIFYMYCTPAKRTTAEDLLSKKGIINYTENNNTDHYEIIFQCDTETYNLIGAEIGNNQGILTRSQRDPYIRFPDATSDYNYFSGTYEQFYTQLYESNFGTKIPNYKNMTLTNNSGLASAYSILSDPNLTAWVGMSALMSNGTQKVNSNAYINVSTYYNYVNTVSPPSWTYTLGGSGVATELTDLNKTTYIGNTIASGTGNRTARITLDSQSRAWTTDDIVVFLCKTDLTSATGSLYSLYHTFDILNGATLLKRFETTNPQIGALTGSYTCYQIITYQITNNFSGSLTIDLNSRCDSPAGNNTSAYFHIYEAMRVSRKNLIL